MGSFLQIPDVCAKFRQNQLKIIATVRARTDRQTDTQR